MDNVSNLTTFKKGHQKMGGRKKGVPNKFSGGLRQAIIAAATEVGDGDGCGGLVGYLIYIAANYPKSFAKLLGRILTAELKSELKSKPGPLSQTFNLNHLNDGELLAFQQIVEKACTDAHRDSLLNLIDESREMRARFAELQKHHG